MSLVVDQLSKYYGKQAAVDNISFELKKGEISGFLGPNGAGKSTTFKMMTGFLSPNHGRVLINGIDVAAEPIKAKREIGYLAEHNPLYNHMYVKEFLRFVGGLHGIKSGLSKRINDVIELTDLGKECHKHIGSLSKGYKQRVGIAQALIHNPAVLILDEPLSGLDPNQLTDLREVIRDLGAEKTLLFSSHILQEVEQLCERIILINDGKIVGDGSQNELMSGVNSQQLMAVKFNKLLNDIEFKGLAAVVDSIDLNDGVYILQSSDEGIYQALNKFATQNGLHIELLERKSTDLNSIFKSLTADA